uniref:Nucleoside diphosphate kinase n=2 Tax=Glossina morsitans morsitans TaxID=37546 RepID=A0A1B0FB49_GLOMM
MRNFSETSSSVTSALTDGRSSERRRQKKILLMIGIILALFSCISNAMASNKERTFIMIKPDGVQRGLVGKIIERFEQKGFKLVAMKFMWASKDLLEKHYADLSSRPFFPGLVSYMNSGPVVPMVWEGLNVVKTGRRMLGETNPADSLPGTIRGDFCIQVGRNIIHGSDAVESAEKEIALWFDEKELVAWKPATCDWVYE